MNISNWHFSKPRGVLLPMNGMPDLLPGLALTALIAVSAGGLAHLHLLATNGIGSLTLAILIGMLVGNTFYVRIAAASAAGVGFSKQSLLRLGIVAYGLRLTFHDVASVGSGGIIIDVVMLTSTFALACWFGPTILQLDRRTSLLIGIGSSICGAAAVLAAEPVVRGRPENTAVAVATVVVFGTLGMFAYPALFRLNAALQLFHVSPAAYGIFVGSTIHEVAQVLVAGRAIGESAAATAVIVKMVRVLMLAPFLIALATLLRRRRTASGSGGAARTESLTRTVPWFAVGFVVLAAVNSCGVLPKSSVETTLQVDGFVLAMAMAALGVTTQWRSIRAAGLKPLLLATTLFVWLTCGGVVVNALVHLAFG